MINLLDGLRDLKAPLASGLIILFGFWLIFANEVASAGPGPSIAGNIRQLVTYLGAPATLGVVAFLGYIIGLVLSLHVVTRLLMSSILGRARDLFAIFLLSRRQHVGDYRWRGHYSRFMKLRLDLWISNVLSDAVEKNGWTLDDVRHNLSESYRRANPLYSYKMFPDQRPEEESERESIDNYRRERNELRREITSDIGLLATQLHAEKDKIYEKYDKNKTESDFRAGIALPVVFVGIILQVRLRDESQPELAGLVVITACIVALGLAIGSHVRLLEANEAVLNSLVAGHIKSGRMMVFEQPPQRKPDEDTVNGGGASPLQEEQAG